MGIDRVSQALKDVNASRPKKGKKQNKTQIQDAKNIHQTQIASNNTKPHNRIKSTGEMKINTTKCKCKMQNETPIQKVHTIDAKKKQ